MTVSKALGDKMKTAETEELNVCLILREKKSSDSSGKSAVILVELQLADGPDGGLIYPPLFSRLWSPVQRYSSGTGLCG